MSNSAIAIRYAKALLNLAIEADQVEDFAGELGQVADLLKEHDLLRLLLDSPTFPLEKKSAILSEVLQLMELSEGLQRYLSVVLEKGRIIYVPQIYGHYRKLADERSGLVRAHITAANKLTKAGTDRIQKGLEEQTGKQVVLSIDTDSELIGGLRAEMGGKLFDGSVKTQLKRISNTLAKG